MSTPRLPSLSFNDDLLASVHPPGWKNPTPTGRYNLVVVGAGTAGLVSAAGAAGLGAKVALIERHLLGGDCLNVGCVPSKAILRAAHAADDARRAKEFGVDVGSVHVDFAQAMERLRRLRAKISPNDSVARFTKLGVDVYLGDAVFTGPTSVAVDGALLTFSKAIIATGARAAAPDIPGLEEAGYLTNETLFDLTELPRRLAVIGAGPIGMEMAQAFRRLGSDVTVIERGGGVLPRDDREAASIVQRSLEEDGVQFLFESRVKDARRLPEGRLLTVERVGQKVSLDVDAVLVAAGRAPNVEGLGLESAGVAYDRGGVQVDGRLRTTNPRIFAAGDVCSAWKFTHAADAMARIAIRNALFLGRAQATNLLIPWSTYTDPEIAQVGMTVDESQKKDLAIQSFTQHFGDVDRAILEGEPAGFVRIHVRKGSDRIVGATVVGRHAGELISEITLAMHAGVGLGQLSSVIHPYPTRAEAIKRCGDQFQRTRLTPTVAGLFRRWLRWTR
jgi:pyruvate/2-oxoglutarate dehydrogenase complex dihydrolipoamide dehydrogenase (E3) component